MASRRALLSPVIASATSVSAFVGPLLLMLPTVAKLSQPLPLAQRTVCFTSKMPLPGVPFAHGRNDVHVIVGRPGDGDLLDVLASGVRYLPERGPSAVCKEYAVVHGAHAGDDMSEAGIGGCIFDDRDGHVLRHEVRSSP